MKIWLRVLWSVLMLYFASGLLGIFIGLADYFHPLRSENEVWYSFIGMPLPIWFGITLFPFLWILFPLACANNELIRYIKMEAEQGSGGNG